MGHVFHLGKVPVNAQIGGYCNVEIAYYLENSSSQARAVSWSVPNV